jgi:hypothetical protein
MHLSPIPYCIRNNPHRGTISSPLIVGLLLHVIREPISLLKAKSAHRLTRSDAALKSRASEGYSLGPVRAGAFFEGEEAAKIGCLLPEGTPILSGSAPLHLAGVAPQGRRGWFDRNAACCVASGSSGGCLAVLVAAMTSDGNIGHPYLRLTPCLGRHVGNEIR